MYEDSIWVVCFVCGCSVQRARVFFFFQAEDGIRDLVRSRGLGDVYKRQILDHTFVPDELRGRGIAAALARKALDEARQRRWTVSYTHLTLPTSDLV